MKNHIMKMEDKILLHKRVIIETINDELKNHCQAEDTWHRSVKNFMMNVLEALKHIASF